ncbi:MAG: hypothetical protein M2R45_03031 [Verrucomicrobia subdivision 3 bacterium]|nr:hypothetical protein [Limisphaerales bacterium]MCS1415551.1 hypothetical protein [Limisphaerales bacterium]
MAKGDGQAFRRQRRRKQSPKDRRYPLHKSAAVTPESSHYPYPPVSEHHSIPKCCAREWGYTSVLKKRLFSFSQPALTSTSSRSTTSRPPNQWRYSMKIFNAPTSSLIPFHSSKPDRHQHRKNNHFPTLFFSLSSVQKTKSVPNGPSGSFPPIGSKHD